jgi:DNA-directed RNA polymerase sigma subunit (sigma70/sigma32)
MWMNSEKDLNCCLLAAQEEHTLQEIGDIFGVTRMRICQLEKMIIRKIDDNSGVSQ